MPKLVLTMAPPSVCAEFLGTSACAVLLVNGGSAAHLVEDLWLQSGLGGGGWLRLDGGVCCGLLRAE